MPISGDVLLDTSVIIPYFRKDARIRAQIQSCSNLYLPQTVLGELFCGAYLSKNQVKTIAEIRNLLLAVVVLVPSESTAEHYGQIRAHLSIAGTPIPENDIWIAAIAREFQIPLATRDEHFDRIPDIQVLKW